MKEDKSIFLKVDCVEPVLKGGGICSRETYLDGVKVWIGDYGYFFPCDQYTVCVPDVVREAGRREVVALIKEITELLSFADRNELFGYCTFSDIMDHFSYEEVKKKLDAWKKEKETIRVRDEVCHESMQVKFVVTKIFSPSGNEDTIVNGIKKDGTTVKGLLLCNLTKTGLHVDDLDLYLEV